VEEQERDAGAPRASETPLPSSADDVRATGAASSEGVATPAAEQAGPLAQPAPLRQHVTSAPRGGQAMAATEHDEQGPASGGRPLADAGGGAGAPAAQPGAPAIPATPGWMPAPAGEPGPRARPPANGFAAADPDAATYQDLPAPPPAWYTPGHAHQRVPARPGQGRGRPERPLPTHVPWQASNSWGPTTITITANTAAGAAYLFWWVTGLLIYFSERQNRFVRFHAMQSILLTGALTVYSVLAYILVALCFDIGAATHQPFFNTLGAGIEAFSVLAVLFAWLLGMISAWTGNYIRFPLIGRYAERYSAPPSEPSGAPYY
jgi:uncharacterized membrane protein